MSDPKLTMEVPPQVRQSPSTEHTFGPVKVALGDWQNGTVTA